MKTNEYRYGNAVVYINRPELTKEERQKRERQIVVALQQIGREINERGCKK